VGPVRLAPHCVTFLGRWGLDGRSQIVNDFFQNILAGLIPKVVIGIKYEVYNSVILFDIDGSQFLRNIFGLP
jgi:hypothetical protein